MELPPPPDRTTRDRILSAAADCFAAEGYRRTRMVAVASRAGVSRAGLYRYFPTKESLLIGLNEAVIAGWIGLSQRTLTEGVPAMDAITTWLREGLSGENQLAAVRVLAADEAQQTLLLDREAAVRAIEQTARMLGAVCAAASNVVSWPRISM